MDSPILKKRKHDMIVDMHCHVLPGVDDGPKTVSDSIAVLRKLSVSTWEQ